MLRALREDDYPAIIGVLDAWWGGRRMADLLPRLFFQHFCDTSLAVEEDGQVVAFLVGFLSQSRPSEAYIHFVGVDPALRGRSVGRTLYERFFALARARGARVVHCVTSPVNTGSIAFHRALGFRPTPGDGEVDGIPVHLDYDGHGGSRVVFERDIA